MRHGGLVVVVLLTSLHAVPSQAVPELRVTAAVHLRAGPSTQAKSLAVLASGASVTSIDTSTVANGFERVKTSDGATGFVAAEYLVLPRPAGIGPADAVTTTSGTAVTGCCLERADVKYLLDPGASAISPTPVTKTISQLRALTKPHPLPRAARANDVERTVYQVTGNVTAWELEADGDIHLVLTSTSNNAKTIVLESPSPACTGGTPAAFRGPMTQARQDIVARLGQPPQGSSPQPVNPPLPVTVTGVGFFDTRKHSLGHPPNCFELHPLLSFTPGN